LTCFGFCFVGYAAEQVTCDRHDIHAVLLNVTLNTKSNSSNICPDLPPRESRYPINAVCFSDVSMVTREPASHSTILHVYRVGHMLLAQQHNQRNKTQNRSNISSTITINHIIHSKSSQPYQKQVLEVVSKT
jgi:hypothetical protein